MRFNLLYSFILLCTLGSVQAQVVQRDTLIEWSHFDYSMNADYGLDSYSDSDIVTSTFDGIVLENEYVKICLIPEFGARIISYVYKPTGKEQLYQNPVGVPYQIGSGIFYHDWLMVYGGIFPTFPEPEHGKYWNVPWNESIIESSSDVITISMSLKDELDNPRRPGQYNKGVTGITCYYEVTLEAGKPYFTVDVRLENDGSPSRYEYWTCLTLAPGSEIGNTFTPSNSEMIVPIDRYQVGWNPGNWLNGLDEVVQSGNPRVQVYDKLAHLSEWEDQGIAYAYPTLTKDFYGVINHDNEQGVFRISSDQLTTPGLKFWTWGDEQGLAADPNNFEEEERAYIELWSGTSLEFFEDANLAADQTIQWTETYWPTVGIPMVSFMTEEIAFGALQNEQALDIYGFQPVATNSTYQLQVSVRNEQGLEVYHKEEDVSPDLLQPSQLNIDLERLALDFGTFTITSVLLQDGQEVHSESFEYEVLGDALFDPQIRLSNGLLELTFQNERPRTVQLHDLMGRKLMSLSANDRTIALEYPQHGIYVLNVIVDGTRWSKKIQVLDR